MDNSFFWLSSSFYYLSFLIQLVCIIHAVREKKEYYWIFIIFFFSLLGVLAYVFLEVLPEIKHRPYLRSLGPGGKVSNRKLRILREELEFSPTIDSKINLADALLSREQFEEAIELYRDCLRGIYKDDPHIMFRLSEALYRQGGYEESILLLKQMEQLEFKDYRNEREFQLAMCLSNLDRTEEAIILLENLADIYPGEEARYQLGLEYMKSNRLQEARETFQNIVKNQRLYKKAAIGSQKKWINLARKSLKMTMI